MARKRYYGSLEAKTHDTLFRYKHEHMVDTTKLINKLLDDYFNSIGMEIRENTPEENEKYKIK